MRYKLLLDESGDHGLNNIDSGFPVFVLCGVLISDSEYQRMKGMIDELKIKYFGNTNVILHSRDIRKCNDEFQILFDLALKKAFYDDLNDIMTSIDYNIIVGAILKEEFIKKYGKLKDDVYEVALSFIMERTIFCLDDKSDVEALDIGIEKRGKKEDNKLSTHIETIRSNGTYYVKSNRFRNIGSKPHFFSKRENISGLQMSDLLAYPIARYVIDSTRVNPAFQLIESKIYSNNGRRHGLKIFP
ncbi:MAG: hypothetical protein BM557_06630 [Flavobacterium sp. MedPE-SWcel]|uniref:DUF3800 domain-containing protein n=1 Tax=uncultured Flavobacterium sp. TaxID=165435 RepID=UPI0009232A98|nr:DUF3800 domain-containing protein [uncultured Flavobacterium sp.]OIQ19375.1 MAG: hypothetical protein BM557_06630 [Flavobacterium sp. MedPE-SWcel]